MRLLGVLAVGFVTLSTACGGGGGDDDGHARPTASGRGGDTRAARDNNRPNRSRR